MKKTNEDVIIYLSGGYLGDFFMQLSVIKENYLKNKKKALLYISDIKQDFRNPIDVVYNDTYNIIMSQEYIYDYQLYNNDNYDIDLSYWRKDPLLTQQNFYETYKWAYNIELGNSKWIDVPYDEKWKNVVLINIVPYRFMNNINYEEYKLKYPECKFIFISIYQEHYNFFIQNTNALKIDIQYYCPSTLLDAVIAINSCNFFMGSESSLLCIAYSLHKKSVTLGSCNNCDNILHSNMEFLNTTYNF